MRRLFIILLLLATACTDNPADPEPAGVSAVASSPAQAYTGEGVRFSAGCSSPDGLESATLEFSSPVSEGSFTRTEPVSGNNFSESFSHTFTSEGEATLQISCSSTQSVNNTAQTSTFIEQFTTDLNLELRNAATGELQEGYVLAGSDSLHTASGIIDVDLTDRSISSIHSGLILDGRAGSYIRKTTISAGVDNSSELYHVDFLFRDVNTGAIVGELSRDGYDYYGPMDITRFLMHLDDNILVNGRVPRWKDYVPDKIVFTDSVSSEVTGAEFHFKHSDEADLLFNTYKGQHEEIIQPHLVENLPFERVDHFMYTGEEAVNGMIVIAPADIENHGSISLFRDASGVNVGSFISVRDVLPDKDIRPNSYAIALNRVFLHEIYSALINPGRSSTHTRPEESILTGSDSLLNQISNEDSKVLYELSQNPRIDFDELVSEYLILPNGF